LFLLLFTGWRDISYPSLFEPSELPSSAIRLRLLALYTLRLLIPLNG
jgi:hypothetical protein